MNIETDPSISSMLNKSTIAPALQPNSDTKKHDTRLLFIDYHLAAFIDINLFPLIETFTNTNRIIIPC